jgi:hypothetical protein
MSPQSEERREVCKWCGVTIVYAGRWVDVGDYSQLCRDGGQEQFPRRHAPSIPTETREERDGLKKLLNVRAYVSVAYGCGGYFGPLHYIDMAKDWIIRERDRDLMKHAFEARESYAALLEGKG